MKSDGRISFNTIIIQNKEIDATDMDGEKVMMNLNKGSYYALNSIGSRVWELIQQPQAVIDIISTLLEEYEVDAKTCQDCVLTFLNRLNEEELISSV